MAETVNTEQNFCASCIYDDGEDCLRITPAEIICNRYGEIVFCAGRNH